MPPEAIFLVMPPMFILPLPSAAKSGTIFPPFSTIVIPPSAIFFMAESFIILPSSILCMLVMPPKAIFLTLPPFFIGIVGAGAAVGAIGRAIAGACCPII